MPLSEKIRIEIFIPDLPDPLYGRLLEEFGDELSYAFGGCTVVSTAGKYRSAAGVILPDRVNILFTDAPFQWKQDRFVIERYAEGLQEVIQQTLKEEETILISVYPVHHIN